MSLVLSGENLDPDDPRSSEVFFTTDKKAYTEDNVLIYNIIVYNIPRWLKDDHIFRYFSKFGVISELRLVDEKERCCRFSPTVGFVNFVEPESAYRVLQKCMHCIRYSFIEVKTDNSWNQPDAEKAYSQKKRGAQQRKAEALNVDTNFTVLNVLSLNDDCLEIICGLLGLRDQIRFARVCNRFEEIFKMLSRRAYKRFEFRKLLGMTFWEIRDFFHFAGKNIEKTTGGIPFKHRQHIIQLIRTCCVNLKRITLYYCEIKPDCLKKLFRSFPLLRELNVTSCDLHDLSIQSLQYLTQLESLTLSDNWEITGKFIKSLVQLKVLNLCGCKNIKTSHLIEMCRSMPNLKSLDIRRCERLSPIFYDSMAEHCPQLEILKISCPDFPYEHVSLLPRLKHIELLLDTSFSVSHTQIFFKLVENKSQQLETLKIYGKNSINPQEISFISKLKKLKSIYFGNNQAIDANALQKLYQLEQLEELFIRNSWNLTNEALIKLLRSYKHLRHLNIEYCRQITCEFVLEAINILKDRKDGSQLPFVLFVYRTSIDKYGMSECQKYMEAKKESLIKIVFEPLIVEDDPEDDLYGTCDSWLFEESIGPLDMEENDGN
ncbi:dynein regulatory complex subunit 6-like [Anastrepha obliqua]|uniref:dynein regulatory complex subunit 6-like n=1 Tax=Anastrepha obliqua TaxID=95512 RepID=UPI00240A283C|nr:dynein regulatory complex subunit 6-like [Anastrepha obliqua]